MKSSKQISFQSLCKERLREIFIQSRNNSQTKQYLMILDKKTIEIISSCFKMTQLTEMGVTTIDQITVTRKPLPNMEAIYFLSSEQNSIKLLLNDFSKKSIQYGLVHLFFTTTLENDLMNQIAGNQFLLPRVKTMIELNFDFVIPDNNSFHFDFKENLSIYQEESKKVKDAYINKVAIELTNLLPTFQRFYNINILYNQNSINLTQEIALQLQKNIVDQISTLEKNNSEQVDKLSQKIYILLLDRSVDLIFPLLHDFSYQSLIYDFLKTDQNMLSLSQVDSKFEDKKIVLNDEDRVFQQFRYKHLADTLKGIPEQFKKFVQDNKAASAKTDKKVLSIKGMQEILLSIPEYQELTEKYNLHVKLIEKVYQLFGEKQLKDVGEVEQMLLSNIDDTCAKVSKTKVVKAIQELLTVDYLNSQEKQRLLAATLLIYQVEEKVRKQLTSQLKASEVSFVIKILQYFGQQLSQIQQSKYAFFSSKIKYRLPEQFTEFAKQKVQSSDISLNRNVSIIEFITHQIVQQINENSVVNCQNIIIPNNNTLQEISINNSGEDNTASIKSLKQKGKLAHIIKSDQPDAVMLSKQIKLIVFVAGGICQSELSALSKINYPKNLIVAFGGTNQLTTQDLMKEINKLQ